MVRPSAAAARACSARIAGRSGCPHLQLASPREDAPAARAIGRARARRLREGFTSSVTSSGTDVPTFSEPSHRLTSRAAYHPTWIASPHTCPSSRSTTPTTAASPSTGTCPMACCSASWACSSPKGGWWYASCSQRHGSTRSRCSSPRALSTTSGNYWGTIHPSPSTSLRRSVMSDIVGFDIHRGCLGLGVRPRPMSIAELVGRPLRTRSVAPGSGPAPPPHRRGDSPAVEPEDERAATAVPIGPLASRFRLAPDRARGCKQRRQYRRDLPQRCGPWRPWGGRRARLRGPALSQGHPHVDRSDAARAVRLGDALARSAARSAGGRLHPGRLDTRASAPTRSRTWPPICGRERVSR